MESGMPENNFERKSTFDVCGKGPDGIVFYEGDSQEDAMRWIEELLLRVADFSLMGKLNDIQSSCSNCAEGGVAAFPNKFAIPLVIVNLVLAKFNLSIVRHGK